MTPQVAVVDDDSLLRQQFPAAFPALDVVATYATVEALLAARPVVDLVVLDLHLSTRLGASPCLQGPAAIRRLASEGYRVCLFTDERRPLVLAHCLSSGAVGLTRKSDPLDTIQGAFLLASAGGEPVAASALGLAEVLARRGSLPHLTQRQVEILSARARGETWASIARRLSITQDTATEHLYKAMSKVLLFLHQAQLEPDASPGDVERAMGLGPGDVLDAHSGRYRP